MLTVAPLHIPRFAGRSTIRAALDVRVLALCFGRRGVRPLVPAVVRLLPRSRSLHPVCSFRCRLLSHTPHRQRRLSRSLLTGARTIARWNGLGFRALLDWRRRGVAIIAIAATKPCCRRHSSWSSEGHAIGSSLLRRQHKHDYVFKFSLSTRSNQRVHAALPRARLAPLSHHLPTFTRHRHPCTTHTHSLSTTHTHSLSTSTPAALAATATFGYNRARVSQRPPRRMLSSAPFRCAPWCIGWVSPSFSGRAG